MTDAYCNAREALASWRESAMPNPYHGHLDLVNAKDLAESRLDTVRESGTGLGRVAEAEVAE